MDLLSFIWAPPPLHFTFLYVKPGEGSAECGMCYLDTLHIFRRFFFMQKINIFVDTGYSISSISQ